MSVQDGWMPGVEVYKTAAYGDPRIPAVGMWPKQVVSHVMQGFQSTMIDWSMQRPPIVRASAHFTIGRDGRICQHVSIWDPAWHVAWDGWNLHSIGIEHEGFSVPPGYGYDYVYSDAQPWPEAMIKATIQVHQWVMEAIRVYDPSVVPGEATILTHALTGQPDRVYDPGDAFMRQVRPRILESFGVSTGPTTLELVDNAATLLAEIRRRLQ